VTLAVVIPVFNHEAYIAAAIHSVLAQNPAPERVLVIDDGSTDRSAEIAQSIPDQRVRVIRQQNAGAHAALNRGIREAAGASNIGILNSDDLYLAGRVEKCLGFLDANPGCDVVCTGLKMIDSAGAELPHSRRGWLDAVWSDPPAGLLEWLGIANFAKTSSNFIGRAAWFQNHPFHPWRYVHDYHFVLACAIEGKLGVVREPLLAYRTHQSNTIKSSPRENVIRETVAMNLILLGEIAPRLARDAASRRGYAAYLRTLFENHSDFRAELFLSLLANLAARKDGKEFIAEVERMRADSFPELAVPPGRVLRQSLAQKEVIRLQRVLTASRWYASGRALGLTRDLFATRSADPEEVLSVLQRRIHQSRWLSAGRRLGVFPS